MRNDWLLPLFLLLFGPLSAQVEWNPYVGLLTGDREVYNTSALDVVNVYTGDRLLLGADALIGSGQLAPLVGLSYQPNSFEDALRNTFDYHHLQLPLGVAYRLIDPSWDINLLLSAAAAPRLTFGDESVREVLGDDGVNWLGRGGVTLFIDFVSLGFQYQYKFRDPEPGHGPRAATAITLGARF